MFEEHRRQRKRKDEARQQRDAHRQRQRREKIFGDAGEQEDRHMPYIASTAAMMESGMAATMITVSRQLPRKSRIIIAVNPAAIAPPISPLLGAAFTHTVGRKMGLGPP